MYDERFLAQYGPLRAYVRETFEVTTEFYRTGVGRDVRVGMVIVPQFFGDKVNAHLHLHTVVTDGAFDPDGGFHLLPVLERHCPGRILRGPGRRDSEVTHTAQPWLGCVV
jgi:hypothetical protein